MDFFIVEHFRGLREEWTIHKSLPLARMSVKARRDVAAATYVINSADLTLIETHGKVGRHVEGQQPLF